MSVWYHSNSVFCTCLMMIVAMSFMILILGPHPIPVILLVVSIIVVVVIVFDKVIYPTLAESIKIKKAKKKEALLASQITIDDFFNCPYCGRGLIIGTPFCEHCGKNLRDIIS